MVVGVNTRGALASQGVFVASRITEAVRELRALGIAVRTTDTRCTDDEASAAREAAEAAARAAEQAVQAASSAADEAAEAAASAATEAVGSVVEETERRMDATEDRVALGLWITLGMAAVMFPTLMFLTMRAPRREVVRVFEQAPAGGARLRAPSRFRPLSAVQVLSTRPRGRGWRCSPTRRRGRQSARSRTSGSSVRRRCCELRRPAHRHPVWGPQATACRRGPRHRPSADAGRRGHPRPDRLHASRTRDP